MTTEKLVTYTETEEFQVEIHTKYFVRSKAGESAEELAKRMIADGHENVEVVEVNLESHSSSRNTSTIESRSESVRSFSWKSAMNKAIQMIKLAIEAMK